MPGLNTCYSGRPPLPTDGSSCSWYSSTAPDGRSIRRNRWLATPLLPDDAGLAMATQPGGPPVGRVCPCGRRAAHSLGHHSDGLHGCWCQHGVSMVSTWWQHGVNTVATWRRHGVHVESTQGQQAPPIGSVALGSGWTFSQCLNAGQGGARLQHCPAVNRKPTGPRSRRHRPRPLPPTRLQTPGSAPGDVGLR
jgi:hypothetical protein